jgi:hypothetical protein
MAAFQLSINGRFWASTEGIGGENGAFGTTGTAAIKDRDFSMLISGKYLNKGEWESPYTFQNGASIFSIRHTIPSEAAGLYVGARYKNLSLMVSTDQSTSSYFIPPFQVAGTLAGGSGLPMPVTSSKCVRAGR